MEAFRNGGKNGGNIYIMEQQPLKRTVYKDSRIEK